MSWMAPRMTPRFAPFDDGELEVIISRLEAEDVDDGPSLEASTLALEARIEQHRRKGTTRVGPLGPREGQA